MCLADAALEFIESVPDYSAIMQSDYLLVGYAFSGRTAASHNPKLRAWVQVCTSE